MTVNLNALTTTRYLRNETGPYARTEVELANNRLLTITTRRAFPSAPLKTTASVGHVEGNFVIHTAMRDFVETLAATKPARLTEATVKVQHDRVLATLPDLIERVEDFYAGAKPGISRTSVAALGATAVSSQAFGQAACMTAGA